jgi:hypothetical protein
VLPWAIIILETPTQEHIMAEILGYLIVGVIAITLAVIAIKIVIALLPVILVIGGICLFVWFLGSSDSSLKEVEHQVNHRKNTIEQSVVRFRDDLQRNYHEQMLNLTRQKAGVNLDPIRPELDSAISVVAWAYHTYLEDDNFKPLITSANDYEGHTQQSAHYVGAAIDFRIKDVGNRADREKLAALVREELGDRFLVLHEDIGRANEHLHVQLRSGTYDRRVVWK